MMSHIWILKIGLYVKRVIFRSTSQVIFACVLYICGDVVVDCGAISFQSDLY